MPAIQLTAAILIAITGLRAQGRPEKPSNPKPPAWLNLQGKPMPELPAATWLAPEGAHPTTASLQKKAWILLFTTPGSPADRAAVNDLERLYEARAIEGLEVVVLAYSREDDARQELVTSRKLPFPVGSFLPGIDIYDFIGVEGGWMPTPRLVVIDANGIVVGHEMPDSRQLDALLAKTFSPEIERELHESLGTARAAYEAGFIGVAHALARKLAREDAPLGVDAAYLVEKCARHASWSSRDAELDRADRSPEIDYGRLLVLERRLGGLGGTRYITTRLAELKRSPRVEREAKLWSAFEKLLDGEVKAQGADARRREHDLAMAARDYDKFATRERACGAARFARDRAEALGDHE